MEFFWQLMGADVEAHSQTLDKDRTQTGDLWVATFGVLETSGERKKNNRNRDTRKARPTESTMKAS